MSTPSQTPAAQPPLRIEGEMTIFRAAELKPLLLATPAPTQVDLSAVTEMDTAGIQLLMLARREARAQGRDLRLMAPSAPVALVIELLDLAAFFGDALAAVAEPCSEVTP